MATFKVSQSRRGRRFRFEGNDGKLRMRRELEYSVEVFPADGENIDDVTDLDVITATKLPKTNYSVYEHSGKIIPYLLCKRKRAAQDAKRKAQWVVTCEYESNFEDGKEESAEQAAADPLTYAPKVERSTEVVPYVIYRDFNKTEANQNKGDPLVRPGSGKFWDEPSKTDVTIVVLTITQYEFDFSDDVLVARNLKANEGTYRAKDRFRWYIADITQNETEILGLKCHQVQYVVKLHPFSWGWKERRALIDTHYIDANGKRRPFLRLGQPTTGWVNEDGTYRKKSDGLAFVDLELRDTIEFDFLQRTNS